MGGLPGVNAARRRTPGSTFERQSDIFRAPMDSTRLWWRAPAARWFGAAPIGNGRLGGMVFGRVYKETVQTNEETLWTRLADRTSPDARAHIAELRPLLL